MPNDTLAKHLFHCTGLILVVSMFSIFDLPLNFNAITVC